MNQVSLCGQVGQCQRLCSRDQYCQLGRSRVSQLLELQRQRRLARRGLQLRWVVVGQLLEARINQFAPQASLSAFSRQLQRERARKAKEVCS